MLFMSCKIQKGKGKWFWDDRHLWLNDPDPERDGDDDCRVKLVKRSVSMHKSCLHCAVMVSKRHCKKKKKGESK